MLRNNRGHTLLEVITFMAVVIMLGHLLTNTLITIKQQRDNQLMRMRMEKKLIYNVMHYENEGVIINLDVYLEEEHMCIDYVNPFGQTVKRCILTYE